MLIPSVVLNLCVLSAPDVTLGLTEGTIKGHVNVLFRKLGVKTRTQATRLALEQGIVRGRRR